MDQDHQTKLLAELLPLLEKAEQQAIAAEVSSDHASETISRMIHKLISVMAQSPGLGPRRRVSAECEQILRKIARPISLLTIKLNRSGQSEVTIDDGKPFKLSRKLMELLEFAGSGKVGDNGVVSYRTTSEAAAALSVSKHVIVTRVYRLRWALLRHGWNPYLLDTRGSEFRILAKKLVIVKPIL